MKKYDLPATWWQKPMYWKWFHHNKIPVPVPHHIKVKRGQYLKRLRKQHQTEMAEALNKWGEYEIQWLAPLYRIDKWCFKDIGNHPRCPEILANSARQYAIDHMDKILGERYTTHLFQLYDPPEGSKKTPTVQSNICDDVAITDDDDTDQQVVDERPTIRLESQSSNRRTRRQPNVLRT